MSKTQECIEAIDKVLTDLRAKGMDTVFIMSAFAEIAARIAKHDRVQRLPSLEALVAVLDTTAQAMRGKKIMNMAQASFA